MPGKTLRKCSLCKNVGHNKRNCPNKSTTIKTKQKVNLEIPENFNINKISYYDYTKEPTYLKEAEIQRKNIIARKEALDFEKEKKKDKLWFDTQKEAKTLIQQVLFIDNKNICLVVAQPGVGKTNLIHAVYYLLKVELRCENLILGNRITIATGMSSCDWIKQTAEGTNLEIPRQ